METVRHHHGSYPTPAPRGSAPHTRRHHAHQPGKPKPQFQDRLSPPPFALGGRVKVREGGNFPSLYGQVGIKLNGVQRLVRAGEVVTIERGVKPSFARPSGAVIEEISSPHAQSDSPYTDPQISRNRQRKTFIAYWLD